MNVPELDYKVVLLPGFFIDLEVIRDDEFSLNYGWGGRGWSELGTLKNIGNAFAGMHNRLLSSAADAGYRWTRKGWRK